jgi:hypothetical protein
MLILPKDQVPTYLSVDIDFFAPPYYASDEEVLAFLNLIRDFATTKNVPIHAMMNHNQMLKHVDSSQARRLINLDAHSDLADKDVDERNIGTWISYVKWRKEGEYFWLRNERDPWAGECGYFFTPRQNKKTDWKKVKTLFSASAINSEQINDMNLVGIGVCMSPIFCSLTHEWVFQDWVKDNKILYTKGVRKEHNYCRDICPPK